MTRKRWLKALERRYGWKNPAVKAAWALDHFPELRDGHRIDRKSIEESARYCNEHVVATWTVVNSTQPPSELPLA